MSADDDLTEQLPMAVAYIEKSMGRIHIAIATLKGNACTDPETRKALVEMLDSHV